MRTRLADILERAAAGRVLSVFCEDVGAARPELRAATEEQEHVPTLVALEWERAPALAAELDEIRDALARAAASLWPDWYITADCRFERKRGGDVELSQVVAELGGAEPKPSLTWLKRAWQRCAKGQLPLVPPLTSAEQVRQLARALDPQRLVFVLSVEVADASDARVRGLSRAAEWLAYESQAKVILLVPLAWQGHREMDHVAYHSLVLPVEPAMSGTAAPTAADPPVEPARGSRARVKTRDADAPRVLIGPVVGKPHPGSEVEQLLHAWLTAAPDLCQLFEFNQRLTVFGDSTTSPTWFGEKGGW